MDVASSALPPVHPAIRYLRDHAWARKGLSAASAVLILVAVGLLGYPFATNLYQGRTQARLDDQFASDELKEQYQAAVQGKGKIAEGDSLTRIKIPDIDVDVVVVEGTSASALRAGAGHYPATPLPCEDGNVAIAGHRTTYGKPFADVDKLRPGMKIELITPIGSCTYEIERDPFIVSPKDLSVIAQTPGVKELTLTSCHPKHSAKQRIIVRARLTGVEKATG